MEGVRSVGFVSGIFQNSAGTQTAGERPSATNAANCPTAKHVKIAVAMQSFSPVPDSLFVVFSRLFDIGNPRSRGLS